MSENPQPSHDKRRKTGPIYQIREDGEIVEMVEDPDTGEWWFRHSSTEKIADMWVREKGSRTRGHSHGMRNVRKMGPWSLPACPVGVSHTPGQRAKRLPGTWAMLPPRPDRPVAAGGGVEPAPVRVLGHY